MHAHVCVTCHIPLELKEKEKQEQATRPREQRQEEEEQPQQGVLKEDEKNSYNNTIDTNTDKEKKKMNDQVQVVTSMTVSQAPSGGTAQTGIPTIGSKSGMGVAGLSQARDRGLPRA